MRLATICSLAALLIHSAQAIPRPTAHLPHLNDDRALYGRQVVPTTGIGGVGDDDDASSSSKASSSSAAVPPSSSSSSTPPRSSSSSQQSSSSSARGSSSSSIPPSTTLISTSRSVRTNDNGEVETVTRIITSTPSPSAPPSDEEDDEDSGGMKPSTVIGLSVTGGVVALILIAFIVWKLTAKRFSLDDDADIAWPAAKEPEIVPAARPTPSFAQSNATTSSIALNDDPYAVPPLPPNSGAYRDDPSYYDPYRGPVPQTFYTPPGSAEGHGHGEAIPMSTYNSGRQSPGPNLAYEDPYAAGRRSPGPNMAYGGPPDPMARVGTPMGGPQRLGTPVGPGGVYGDIPRVGTPGSMYGRASPAPPPGYAQQAPPDPYGRRSPGPGYAYGGHQQ